MQILTFKDHSVKIYSSSKEMPINRYSEFQKYLLLDAGIGSSMEAVSLHFEKLHAFIANKMNEEAKLEAENLHYSIYSILNSINYKSLAFACMVHSIDDEEITDLSEENLKLVTEFLGQMGLIEEEVEDNVEQLKKKS